MNSRNIVNGSSRLSLVKMVAYLVVLILLVPLRTSAQTSGAHQNVLAMTRNVYLGADLSPLFRASTPSEAVAAAASIWTDVQATDIPARGAEIADEIASTKPDLVGLQEAEQWWFGPAPTELAVQFDLLQSILDELASRGVHYGVASVIDNTNTLDTPVPIGLSGPFVALIDRDALLVRSDLPFLSVADVHAENFSHHLPIPTAFGTTVDILRGWISADVTFRGNTFRFITTQLESFDVPQLGIPDHAIQQAQALELVSGSGPAVTTLPVVMADDFNSNANGEPGLPDNTPTYDELLANGLTDTWTTVFRNKIGNTCCQAADLLGPSQLTERIDLVLVNDKVSPAAPRDIGGHNGNRVMTSDGLLWPSDHDGVIAMLKIFGSD